jgi:hypothetical protein
MDDDELDDAIEEELILSELLLLTLIQAIIIYYVENNFPFLPMRTFPLSGHAYRAELLCYRNDRHMNEVLRMPRASFDHLVA